MATSNGKKTTTVTRVRRPIAFIVYHDSNYLDEIADFIVAKHFGAGADAMASWPRGTVYDMAKLAMASLDAKS